METKVAYYADPRIARVRLDEPGRLVEQLIDAVVDGAPGCAVRVTSTHDAHDQVEVRYSPDSDFRRVA